ncbi:MAG: hypothetical protein HY906_28340 [Deltaproteobacteria bacterium]|nr:hypothetical protein [Deltaproteobacteria bacterium]
MRPAGSALRVACSGVLTLILATTLGAACRRAPTAADGGHVDFDLAHGLPVIPGARVVYGGTQDDVFTLELASMRPAAAVAAWYRQSLPRIGWRELEVTGPSPSGTMRLRARRGGSWLLARIRSEGVETEATFAKGEGPMPPAATLLPDEGGAGAAAASPPQSGPATAAAAIAGPDGGVAAAGGGPSASAVTPTDLLETLLLPDSVRRVGQPTEHGHAAMAVISSDLQPQTATTEVGRALKEAGWRVDEQGEGILPGARELRASRGAVALRLSLVPAGRGAAGTITVGPPAAVERAAGPRAPKGARGGGTPGGRRP